MNALVRLGAAAGAIAGLLRVAAVFIPYVAGSALLEALYGVIDTGLLLGTIAVHLATAERTGRAGLAAVVVAILGIASLVGPENVAFGIDFYRVGAGVFVLGVATLGGLMLALAGARWRVPGWLWLGCGAATAATALGWTPTAAVAGLALGVGFIASGAIILRSSSRRTAAPSST